MAEPSGIEVDVRASAGAFRLDVRFQTDAGITALFGPSGAGKTSTLRLIAGLNTPDQGRIAVDGVPFYDSQSMVNLPIKDRRCGYVFQDAALFPHLTVERNLTYTPTRVGRPSRLQPQQIYDLLAVNHLLDRHPASLSGGERQRVAIGRALLSSPRLLLLDEPFSGLDAERKLEICGFLESVSDAFKVPIIFVSHSISEVVRLAQNVVFVEKGSVVHSGSVESVLNTSEFDETGLLVGHVTENTSAPDFDIVDIEGQALYLTRRDLEAGKKVRVTIAPSQVILANPLPDRISAQNRLKVEIVEIKKLEGPVFLIRLGVGKQQFCAKITAKAKLDMGLEVGTSCYALLKTIALSDRTYY